MKFSPLPLVQRVLCLLLLLVPVGVMAQTEPLPVPDVTGLTIPAAAAELNRVGYRLGAQNPIPPDATSAQQPGTVISQSIPAGQTAAYGTAVDLDVLSGALVRLVYDDNDLTLQNETGEFLDLNRLTFGSADGSKRFPASRWRGGIDAGDCTQVWSIVRNGAKSVPGCGSTFWMTTNNSAEHFWTQTAGVQNFSVMQDNVERATCPAAPPNSQSAPVECEFYVLSGSLATETTDYLYFVYTTDRFAVINRSDDAWMPVNETPLFNYNPQIQVAGAELNLGDPSLYADDEPLGSVERLAPGQCLLLTVDPLVNAEPPESCDVVAQKSLVASVAFWLADFELQPATRPAQRSTCPAATEGRTTLCVMPR